MPAVEPHRVGEFHHAHGGAHRFLGELLVMMARQTGWPAKPEASKASPQGSTIRARNGDTRLLVTADRSRRLRSRADLWDMTPDPSLATGCSTSARADRLATS